MKTVYSRLHSKIQNKVSTEIFVGYSTSHGTNVYRMFNLKTKSIIVISEILWLKVNYGKWKSSIEKDHDPPGKEQDINNENGLIKINTNIITQVQHPVYNPDDIITEKENKE